MSLTRQQIDALLGMLAQTHDRELTCDECAGKLAEFIENNLPGKCAPEGLEAVEQHLKLCGDCREEFEGLREALRER